MKMLDLFCGAGIGAWGYWRSGRFSQIVGVDKRHNMREHYAFDFIVGDALKLDYEFLMQFDFIHASPPCQAYSAMTPDPSRHERLITGTRLMLEASGVPYCIENVEGSGRELQPNLVMDGHYFGLPSERRRYFRVSTLAAPLRLMSTGETVNIHGGDYTSRREVIRAMGLDCISKNRLWRIPVPLMEQGIVPAMTQHIAALMFPQKFMIGV